MLSESNDCQIDAVKVLKTFRPSDLSLSSLRPCDVYCMPRVAAGSQEKPLQSN